MRPDFFIVGAPKSGTTALYTYLRQHPQVFMPDRKDTPFFGSDLDLRFTYRYGRESETMADYLAYFRGAQGARRVGDASVWYLYSRRAAQEIHDFAPDSTIIALLRNPVDMLYAQHSQFLTNLNEDIEDFSVALAAEGDRRRGRRIPKYSHLPQGLLYRETAKYAEQLERYFKVFGREAVHVIIYDDFERDTADSVRRTLRFLDVDSDVRLELDVVNANSVVRSTRLQRLAMRPPGRAEAIYHALLPRSLHGRAARLLLGLNTKLQPRERLDSTLRERLTRELAPEIDRLATLLNRDLSSWMQPLDERTADRGRMSSLT